jgi:hypothetical protein
MLGSGCKGDNKAARIHSGHKRCPPGGAAPGGLECSLDGVPGLRREFSSVFVGLNVEGHSTGIGIVGKVGSASDDNQVVSGEPSIHDHAENAVGSRKSRSDRRSVDSSGTTLDSAPGMLTGIGVGNSGEECRSRGGGDGDCVGGDHYGSDFNPDNEVSTRSSGLN